jgi:hypothetical protein
VAVEAADSWQSVIKFEFTLSNEEAYSLFDALQHYTFLVNMDASDAAIAGDEVMEKWHRDHAEYIRGIKLKMLNTRVDS